MSHTSGVPAWEQPFSIKDMYDWETRDRAARRAAAVVGAGHGVGLPRGEPGAPGRRGDPADHRARRSSSSSPRRSPARSARTSRSAPGRPTGTGSRPSSRRRGRRSNPDADMTSIAVRTLTGPVMSTKATTTPEWRAADLGALNGHSNARGVLDVMRVLTARRGGRRAPAALAEDDRPDLRRPGRRRGPGAGGAVPVRHRLRADPGAVRAVPARGPGRVLGRLGRLDGRHGPRPAADDHLHDEQDGRRASSGPSARSPTSAPSTPRWTER